MNQDQLNSLVEHRDTLAENLENLVKKERQTCEQLGIEKGFQEGKKQGIEKTARINGNQWGQSR